jgi:hypothetical protein
VTGEAKEVVMTKPTNYQATSTTPAPADLQQYATRAVPIETRAMAMCGVATKYWLELKPRPPGSAKSLWLWVDGEWRILDDPDDTIRLSVQNAFCAYSENTEVAVWYNGGTVEGLVVRSK